jgi:hypothetical protein
MKIQDIVFIIIVVGLFLFKKKELFVWTGIVCLSCSIPLFAKWIFFTAERLTWYAVAFFLIFLVLSFGKERKLKYNSKKGEMI